MKGGVYRMLTNQLWGSERQYGGADEEDTGSN